MKADRGKEMATRGFLPKLVTLKLNLRALHCACQRENTATCNTWQHTVISCSWNALHCTELNCMRCIASNLCTVAPFFKRCPPCISLQCNFCHSDKSDGPGDDDDDDQARVIKAKVVPRI